MQAGSNGWLLRAYGLLHLILGVILGGAGFYLATLGGSLYYLAAGLVLVAAAILIWGRKRKVLDLYALFLCGTVAWSLYEVGLDGWALLPRVAAPLVLGLFLLLPAIRRRLASGPELLGRGHLAGVMIVAPVAGLALHHLLVTFPADPAYQTGTIDLASMKRATPPTDVDETDGDWVHFGGDKGGSRFSKLTQINRDNVQGLELAWTFRVGDLGTTGPLPLPMLQVQPLKIGNVLYLCNGKNDVFALDAETGVEIWRFDAGTDLRQVTTATCRGVAFYRVPVEQGGECAERIITNTVDARLIAIDAKSGKACQSFGDNGVVSLLHGMGDYRGRVIKGYYYVTSAPTIVRDKVVLGGWVSDGQYWGEPSGVIRAFDAITGEFAWAFDVGRLDRQSEPPEGETYTVSTPNSWGPMSADDELGLVYAPLGNPPPDYYGSHRRPFDDRFGSSVVAIDGETGELRWSFQTIYRDVWDYDVASQPVLVDLTIDGEERRALIQPTKRGEIFVLDRVTGEPLSEVADLAVPLDGAVPTERLSEVQPFSVAQPSFRGPNLTEADMWGITPLDQLWCRVKFRQARYDGTLTPPGLTPAIIYPGYNGGMNWGSVAIDVDQNIMIVNSNRVANYLQLVSRADADAMGLRPRDDENDDFVGGAVPQSRTPYAAKVGPFMSPIGVPCQRPPYGLLAGVDLDSGKLAWMRRLGTARDSGPFGIPSLLPFALGTPNGGGALATRSGLTFIAAAQDRYLRAIDNRSGKTLWKGDLPAAGIATPMTYISAESGRQFVIIAAGGHPVLQARTGDYILAFALPEEGR